MTVLIPTSLVSRFMTYLGTFVARQLLFVHEEGGNAVHLVVLTVLVYVLNHFIQSTG